MSAGTPPFAISPTQRHQASQGEDLHIYYGANSIRYVEFVAVSLTHSLPMPFIIEVCRTQIQ